MQRALVVGGAGVVGSHLVDRLLAAGNEVIAIDDLSHGSFANLAHLRRLRQFAFLEHDVRRPYRVDGVDAIYHLAVPSTRLACTPDPVKAMLTCVLGTQHALDAARGAPVVIAVAMERYGEGVRCAESLGAAGAAHIVRLPSAFGPRMATDGNHLVTTLVMQALRGEPLEPAVPLEQRVRLTYVDDAVETLARATEGAPTTIEAPSTELSVLELTQLVSETVGAASDAPDFSPTSDLREGLSRTVSWFSSLVMRAAPRESGIFTRHAARKAG